MCPAFSDARGRLWFAHGRLRDAHERPCDAHGRPRDGHGRSDLERSERSGAIWSNLERSERSGAIWSDLVRAGAIWSDIRLKCGIRFFFRHALHNGNVCYSTERRSNRCAGRRGIFNRYCNWKRAIYGERRSSRYSL